MNIDSEQELTQERVHHVLSKRISSLLAAHGGGIEVHSVSEDCVRIGFTGACRSCMSASESLRAEIEEVLRREFARPNLEVRIHNSVHKDLLAEAKRILCRNRE